MAKIEQESQVKPQLASSTIEIPEWSDAEREVAIGSELGKNLVVEKRLAKLKQERYIDKEDYTDPKVKKVVPKKNPAIKPLTPEQQAEKDIRESERRAKSKAREEQKYALQREKQELSNFENTIGILHSVHMSYLTQTVERVLQWVKTEEGKAKVSTLAHTVEDEAKYELPHNWKQLY